MLTGILSRSVLKLSQIVQILEPFRFRAPFGALGQRILFILGSHWKVRSGLPISVN